MTAAGLLPVVLLAVGTLVGALAVATAGRRVVRRRADRRRAGVAEPLRPVLLRLAAGSEEEVADASRRLLALDAATFAALEPDLVALLLKVRGETHAAVVSVLDRRGTLAQAFDRTTGRSAVTRAGAAELLGAAARRSAVPRLVELLADRDPEVRQVAARALGRVGSASAAGPLLAAVGGPAPVPPRIVAGALARIGASAHPALVEALSGGDPLTAAVAAEIAGLDRAVVAVPVLTRLLVDGDQEVRIRSARALGRIGLPTSVGALLAATADGQPAPLRAVAARALGDLGVPAAVPRLAELTTDSAGRVAANAATALVHCGTAGLGALRNLAGTEQGAHAREALAFAALRDPGIDLRPAGGEGRHPAPQQQEVAR